jgi:hypothetical protein
MKVSDITPKDVNNLQVGDSVCFKYDIEQCGKILSVKRGNYGKVYTVRAFEGGYVDNIDGTVIELQPRDCWID